jgi:hypothetical protein
MLKEAFQAEEHLYRPKTQTYIMTGNMSEKE